MANQEFKIEGLDEILKAMEGLDADVQQKIIKNFLAKVGRKYIVSELKAVLPYSSRSESAIRVVTNKNDKNSIIAGITSDSYWLRWADGGTKERKTKKGANRGSIAPKKQTETTIDSQIDPIIDFASEEFGNEVNKSLERRIKKITKSK